MILARGATPAERPTLPQLIAREQGRKRRRRNLRWALLAAAPVLIALAWLALRPRPVPLAQRFHAAAVARGDVVREVRATGHVEAVTTVQIGAEVSGRLATVDADFNDHVRKGQVLARFDRAILGAQAAQALGALRAAQATVLQAQTDFEQAQRQRARTGLLYSRQLASDAEYDNATVAERVAEQRWRTAQAQVAAQQAAYDLARTYVGKADIYSPIDGIVVTRAVDPGQTVASSFMTPVLFTVAADLRKMRVIAAVDEADIAEVRERQPAAFTVTAWPDRTFAGVVTEVRNSPAVVQEVVTYQAVIEVENADLALKPGMTATVRIRTATASGVLRAPAAALRFAPPGESASEVSGLWTIEGAALRRVPATAGISDGEFTELRSGPPAGTVVLTELTAAGRKAYGLH
ncbi:MAG TPA: efflux RND transporter periplasmic adaptor subunit [Myxococcales bacterium]|nr:efflux RND transporter periplasmic adaptor subunit [Myxococcales bacterium]